MGMAGLADLEVVRARRRYALHLGVTLSGPVQDADFAIHAVHAIKNYKGAPGARHAINLGAARVVRVGLKLVVRWLAGG